MQVDWVQGQGWGGPVDPPGSCWDPNPNLGGSGPPAPPVTPTLQGHMPCPVCITRPPAVRLAAAGIGGRDPSPFLGHPSAETTATPRPHLLPGSPHSMAICPGVWSLPFASQFQTVKRPGKQLRHCLEAAGSQGRGPGGLAVDTPAVPYCPPHLDVLWALLGNCPSRKREEAQREQAKRGRVTGLGRLRPEPQMGKKNKNLPSCHS